MPRLLSLLGLWPPAFTVLFDRSGAYSFWSARTWAAFGCCGPLVCPTQRAAECLLSPHCGPFGSRLRGRARNNHIGRSGVMACHQLQAWRLLWLCEPSAALPFLPFWPHCAGFAALSFSRCAAPLAASLRIWHHWAFGADPFGEPLVLSFHRPRHITL